MVTAMCGMYQSIVLPSTLYPLPSTLYPLPSALYPLPSTLYSLLSALLTRQVIPPADNHGRDDQ